MTPTLLGRLQTRLAVLVVVGLPWTLLLILAAGLPASGALLGWALVTGFGVVLWEPVYHFLQQFRWEKDWPIFLSLVTVLNEAALAWLILTHMTSASVGLFVAQVASTWLLVWLATIGPMRVVVLRWRYRGGRVW